MLKEEAMEAIGMNTISQRIVKQSKVILVLARVTRIVVYVVIGCMALLLASTWMPAEQPLFRLGKTAVYAAVPLKTLFGLEIGAEWEARVASLRVDIVLQLLTFILSQIMLYKITGLFTKIHESKDPFTANAAKPMKAFAVLLGLIIGIQNTILSVVIALVIYAFALIFEYGEQLQTQADETL